MSKGSSCSSSIRNQEGVTNENPHFQSLIICKSVETGILEGPAKKKFPLEKVSPILKKYSSQRHGKTTKSVRPKGKTDAPTKHLKVSCSNDSKSMEAPSSPLHLEVSVEPFDYVNDSNVINSSVMSLVPMNGHSSNINPVRDVAEAFGEESNKQLCKRNTLSKDDASPSSNQTSKIVKQPLTERKKSRIINKRNRLQKELEHTVPLAAVDPKAACEEKGFNYALSYFLKMKERLASDKETFEKFIRLMNDFGSSNSNVVDLYHRITALLGQYPELCVEFLAFLLPEQALQCERFMEHLSLAEMMSFLKKLEVFFIKQPHHLRKIYSCWSNLAENPNLTVEEVRSAIIPLLKGNKLLEDSFVELLPGASPPESKMGYGGGTDVEVLPYEDMDSELSDEEKRSERVDIPGAKNDSYGGENCQCCCHETDEHLFASRSKHCVPCGLKFIAGKVYLQTEHGLRPIRVHFGGSSSYSINLKRLNGDPRKLQRSKGPGRRSRVSTSRPGATSGHTGQGSKDNSPVKGSGKTNYPEEKEEESTTKQKSPRSRSKLVSSRNKEKPNVRATPQGIARTATRAKGKGKISISPPAATYDEIALPAPEPTAAKSDATDFSVLSDVLRQEKIDQAKPKDGPGNEQEVIPIGSDDSNGGATEETNGQLKTTVKSAPVEEADIEEVDGEVISGSSDVSEGGDAEDDGDSDEPMSMDSYGESDVEGASEGEGVGEGEGSSQESEDSMPRQPWTREEDRIILQCFQAAGGQDDSKTFAKISQLLPSRTIEEINARFDVLMDYIRKYS